MALTVGDLRLKIILKAPAFTTNDEGGRDVTYPVENIKTFCAVMKTSQARVNEASSTAIRYTKDFYIRWSLGRENITKDWLLIYNGENYIIEEIGRVEDEKEWIKIVASTKSNG